AERQILFSEPLYWGPGAVSIAAGIAVALVLRLVPLGPPRVAALALGFEVVSSYGIAAAEFLHPHPFAITPPTWIGLSWVAVWMLLFNVVVPTRPKHAVLAALASVTAVPAMVLLSAAAFPPPVPPTASMIFFAFVFPY